MTLSFRVFGIPVPEGSTRAWVHDGKAYTTHSNKRLLGPWRDSIANAAVGRTTTLDRPASVRVTFYLPRPKSRTRKRSTPFPYPDVRPDLDKLVRAVLDALTHIAWNDDSQVVHIETSKVYASTSVPPGAQIDIEYLT